MKLPERWKMYTKSGRIQDTPFVACKTPLRNGYSSVLTPENSFTPGHLLMYHPQIKLVIDLTNSYKYYNGNQEFSENGVNYVKIACHGHGKIPSESVFEKFVYVVEEFLRKNPENHLIAVHCTHGVNRTGYFIVRYMMEKMGYDYVTALQMTEVKFLAPATSVAFESNQLQFSVTPTRVIGKSLQMTNLAFPHLADLLSEH